MKLGSVVIIMLLLGIITIMAFTKKIEEVRVWLVGDNKEDYYSLHGSDVAADLSADEIDYDFAISARDQILTELTAVERVAWSAAVPPGVDDNAILNAIEYGFCLSSAPVNYRKISEYEVHTYETSDGLFAAGVSVLDSSNCRLRVAVGEGYGAPECLWIESQLIYVSLDANGDSVHTSMGSKVESKAALISSAPDEWAASLSSTDSGRGWSVNDYAIPPEWVAALTAPAGGSGTWYVTGSYQIRLGGYKYEFLS